MIPNTQDCDYHRGEKIFTREEIRAFKEIYDKAGFIDSYHSVRDVNSANKDFLVGRALKSFLLDSDTTIQLVDGTVKTYPRGTWMLTSEVTNPDTIQQVQKGIITGYSPSIFNSHEAEQIRSALKSMSAGGLIKNISNPEPVLVSLVRKPCQHQSKFCKTNNYLEGEKSMPENDAQSTLDKVKEILGVKTSPNEPEYALKEDIDAIKEGFEAALKSEKEELATFISKTIDEQLEKRLSNPVLKEDANKKEDEGDDDSNNKEEPPANNNDDGDDGGEGDNNSNNKEADDKKSALKGKDSKGLPQHDGGQKPALKSEKAIIMEKMGRDINGRPLQK